MTVEGKAMMRNKVLREIVHKIICHDFLSFPYYIMEVEGYNSIP